MTVPEHYALDPGVRLLLTDLGLSVGNILRRAGLPGDLLGGGTVTVTPAQFVALWEAIAAEADDPALPIRIAEAISVESFHPAVFATICSPNLAVAAARIAKHKALIGPLRLVVNTEQRGLQLELRWSPHHAVPEGLATTELLWWVALARLATRATVRPVAVVSRQAPAAPAEVGEYLGTPVRVGDRYSVLFSHRDAARPFLTANEPMWEFFEPELRKRLAQLQDGATADQRVSAALLELLPSGRGSVDHVARELNVSARTLQRQLQQEGTNFQTVLNRTRESLARHYLTQDALSATDIAFLLGYDEPNSFHRAFQSWTGVTPHQVRVGVS